jgi:hypothetical protein
VPHFYPVVIPAGRSLPGDSLGFHAYSLRIDNLTNQWLLEETSLAWIPPYSLGVCLRLYGTGVAIVLNQAPSGQAQPAPLAGEATVGVFSDQLRTEVAGSPVRQFALVQAVSDLTEGAQPAFPPVGTCRLWADNTGTVHHEHSDGTDYVVLDAHNFTSYVTPPYVLNIVNTQALGGVLTGTLPNPGMAAGAASANVGALGGALTGTLPNPGMAAGGAAANVGALGGVLAGTLPNPSHANIVHVFPQNVGSNGSFITTVDGNGIQFIDSNSKVVSVGRATYFDEYSGGWLWRNSAASFALMMSLDNLGSLRIAGGYSVTGNTARLVMTDTRTVPNTVVVNVLPGLPSGGAQMGLLLVIDANTGSMGLYFIRGGAQQSILISATSAGFTAGFGPAAYNVAWSGTIVSGGAYALENKTGASGAIRTLYLGI